MKKNQTLTLINTGSPHDDTYKAVALHAFMVNNGDIEQTLKALKADEERGGTKAPSKRTLENWAEHYKWERTVHEMRNTLQAQAAKTATQDMAKNLAFLTHCKSRLMEEIEGVKDEHGNFTLPKVQSRSLESCINALCKVMATEVELRGEAITPGTEEKKKAGVLALLAYAQGKANDKTGSDKN